MSEHPYLRNAWYAAAWSEEVGRTLFTRTILEEPVLLYRREDGDAVALGNLCAHRFAPLSMGKLIGDVVQCPYHGLRYGTDGKCILNPHGDGMIPPRMLGDRLLEDMSPALFAADSAAQRVRRVLATLIDNETPSDPQNPSLADLRQDSDPSRQPVVPAV